MAVSFSTSGDGVVPTCSVKMIHSAAMCMVTR